MANGKGAAKTFGSAIGSFFADIVNPKIPDIDTISKETEQKTDNSEAIYSVVAVIAIIAIVSASVYFVTRKSKT